MYRHILLPTDGSELSGRAVKAGLQLAKALDAKVTGFYAAPRYHHSISANPDLDTANRARPEQAASQTAETYLSVIAAIAKAMDVSYESMHVITDSPSDAIVQAAVDRKCDLIFMAPHSLEGASIGKLGSNTRAVLMNSNRSVTVHR
jgi:nucleotide-binding universal stress UspA family protein